MQEKTMTDFYIEEVMFFKKKYKNLLDEIDSYIDKPFMNNENYFSKKEELGKILLEDKKFTKLFFDKIYDFIINTQKESHLKLQEENETYRDLFFKYEQIRENKNCLLKLKSDEIINDVPEILIALREFIQDNEYEKNKNQKKILNAKLLELEKDLTDEEKIVAHKYAKGYTKKMIAEQMSKSFCTIKTQLGSIFSKLNIHSKNELIAKYSEMGEII